MSTRTTGTNKRGNARVGLVVSRNMPRIISRARVSEYEIANSRRSG